MRRGLLAATVTTALAALVRGVGAGAADGPGKRGGGVDSEQVADGLGQPIYTATAPGVGDLVYVVERPGTVRALDPSDGSSVEFLDISGRVSTDGEGGMLSIAFDPDYQAGTVGHVSPRTPPMGKVP